MCMAVWFVPSAAGGGLHKGGRLHCFVNTKLQPGSLMGKGTKSHLERQKDPNFEWHTNCYTSETLKTMMDLTLRLTHPYNIGACTHMKENILSREGRVMRKQGGEWHPDTDSYLKEHFGWNRNLEQSQLKCELSSRKGIKGEKDKEMEGRNDTEEGEKKNQIPQEQPPGGACVADVRRTKAYQMDRSNHFQLCIKLDPLPKPGLLPLSNK